MKYLNIYQVLAIHSEVIEQAGGSKGIRDIGLVDSAVARPQVTFGGKDLYPDIFSKVACLGHSLIRNHPFVDGNKRTGYMSMRLFLNINRYDIKAPEDEKYKFVIEIAGKERDERSIAEWLEKHSQRIK
ncbi:MAG: type II toxin-antitoxin system death-on-curing family toxin [Candidatus Omnitrophica bacterium]|nr:type II toxin-antitoxin system death-on-curing family toxin [Candidatus Omnitrophota bacterium]